MHSSLLLALWALVAFVLYKAVAYVISELRHRSNERELGCKQPARLQTRDPIGIDNVRRLLKADKECRLPDFLQTRTESSYEHEGRVISTFYQNVLGSPAIFTVDPKNIQAILATQFKDFGLGETRGFSFFPLLGWGIFSTDGKQWEHSRALLRPQFVRDQVSDLDLEERHVQNMMRALPTNPDGWTSVTDLKQLFFRLTIDSATEFLFGESTDSQLSNLPGYSSDRPPMAVSANDFSLAFDASQAAMAKAGRFGDMYWVVHNKDFKENCRRCHTFIDHYVSIAINKAEKSSAQPASFGKQKYVFIDALVESTRDPVELRSELISILLAGRDTTASLLSFVLMAFTQYPNVFHKLRSIVIEEFGTYTNPKEITFSGLKGCNYLQWILNETLRMYAVVPINSRRAVKNTTLPTGGGPDGLSPVYVRKGQQVDYSVYVMQRRKDLWGPDANEWNPERWNGRRPGWEFLPFNGGPRICIGQQFALTEAGYVLVRLLQRFDDIEGVGNTWEPVEKGGMGYVRQWLTLTNSPADGVKVKLREAKE